VMLPEAACAAATDPPIETMPAASRAAPVRHENPIALPLYALTEVPQRERQP
jgi:hypothetical protein